MATIMHQERSMPSAQDFAERLREQAYRTLLPQIRDLERELQDLNNSLSAGVRQIGQKLETLQHIELPTTKLVLDEILEELFRQKALKANALARFTRSVRQKETQEEILALLLDCAQTYFPYVALFAVRGDRFMGWSSRGFPNASSQKISSCSFDFSECPQFREALEGKTLVTAADLSSDSIHLEFLRDGVQGPWHLLPLHAMQRPIALLLAIGSEETRPYLDVLSMLADFTVLQLENIALRILYELTAAKSESETRLISEDAIEAHPPVTIPESASETTIKAPEPAPVEEPVFTEDSLRSYLKPVEEEAPAAEPIPSRTAEEMSAAPPHPESEGIAPTTAPRSDVPISQLHEDQQIADEEKLHTEAKKFARLLVSEIKLYNEHHVLEGRENRDLYLRLKRDIDRSREMYEKRVSPIVSQKIDYLHDEIIRTLGDNDPSALGSDYPGPRIES